MARDNHALEDWIALSLLPGLGPRLQRRAVERFGSPGACAYRVSPRDFLQLGRCPRSLPSQLSELRRGLPARVREEIRRCARADARILTLDDEDYPAELREIEDRPVVLYVRGRIRPGVVRVALVGSRRATHYGKRLAAGLAAGLAERGICVVSGGARGIDAAAHRACLEVGGETLVVLGSGIGCPYPEEHAELFDRAARSGAVLSELPLDTPPRPEQFPRRNRLISGLAVAVVVVEAGRRSGALITAGQALDQGREVLAIPGPVSSPQSAGCHRLIQQGAKLVQNIEDILEELAPMFRLSLPQKRSSAVSAGPLPDLQNLGADERSVLALLDEVEPRQLDELADQALFGMGRLHTALFGLQLRGAVEQIPGGYYVLRPSDSTRKT